LKRRLRAASGFLPVDYAKLDIVSDAKDSDPLRTMPRVSHNNHLRDHISASQLTSVASYIITNSETISRHRPNFLRNNGRRRDATVARASPLSIPRLAGIRDISFDDN
jgi:hypothetical protein